MNAEQVMEEINSHFSYIPTECPYGLDHTAVYQQGSFVSLFPGLLERFLDAGFRRNGNTLYSMRCVGCAACVPIRLEAADFVRSRSLKRVWRRNRDLTVQVGPLAVDRERLALCRRFLDRRYPGRGSSAEEYYSGFFCNILQVSVEVAFRLAGRLVGVSIVDVSEKGLSAVYFYFDPDLGERSLGTFNILTLADLAVRHHLRYLYLGYWIEDVPAMSYKSRFRPHFLRRDGEWRRVD